MLATNGGRALLTLRRRGDDEERKRIDR